MTKLHYEFLATKCAEVPTFLRNMVEFKKITFINSTYRSDAVVNLSTCYSFRKVLQSTSKTQSQILTFAMLRALVYLLIEAVAATCFYPNGDANGDTPCYVSKKESNCCGTGYACLSNKVCRLAHEDSTGASMPYSYGRGSCTDRTWTSPSCPLFCLIGSSRR